MTKEIVVITGATGFIGGRVLQLLLQHNYNLRIVVRSVAKKEALVSNACLKGVGQADFFVIPDLLGLGALDDAVANAGYIIHIASPLPLKGEIPPEHQYDKLINPAVQANLRVLEAAQNSRTIKRIVITSSAGAVMPLPLTLSLQDSLPEYVATGDDRIPEPAPPFANSFVAYLASKIAALRASDKFMADKELTFDVVNIQPTFVFGRNDCAQSRKQLYESTNAILLAALTGNCDPNESPKMGMAVHVDDVAMLHILAINQDKVPKTGAGVVNLFINQNIAWEDIPGIAHEKFPEAVLSGQLASNTTKRTRPAISTISNVEDILGRKLKTLEDMVTDTAGQYLEVLQQA